MASLVAPAPAKPASSPRCPPLAPGTVSADDSPPIRGGGPSANALEWLEARGVARPAAITWYRSRFGISDALAEILFEGADCHTVTVGAAREDAIVCEHALSYSWMQVRALVLVVRKKRLVPVLDVGLAMRALDWMDARHLDLALTIEPGGVVATLRDRAPNKTQLVESPRDCREREDMLDACEAALRSGGAPATACPIVRDAQGRDLRVAREAIPSGPLMTGLPAELHDCDAARAEFRKVVAETAKFGGSILKEARDAAAFVDRACRGRGSYVWKDDRFVPVATVPVQAAF